MLAVYKRELKAYFSSITGYVFMGIFLILSGIFFTTNVLVQQSPVYNNVFGSIVFVFLILLPILTIRLLADERKSKTDQLLLTSPLKLSGMVLGKYLAAVTVFVLTLAITFLYPIIISLFGELAITEVISGYIGFFLMGAAFISIGLFISSLTDNQIVAAIVSYGVVLLIWILEMVKQIVPADSMSGMIFMAILAIAIAFFIYQTTKSIAASIVTAIVGGVVITVLKLTSPMIFDGFVGKFVGWFSLTAKLNDFIMGIFSLSPIVYYLSFSAIFVFLTIRIIEKRRWS